ncbi:MAG: radical SAM protein [bacterium]
MILIYPPVAKPSDPPAGMAKLFGTLKDHGVACRLLDANLEGLLYLLGCTQPQSDTWTNRAVRHRLNHLASLKDRRTYLNLDRYKRAVLDLNRVLERSAKQSSVTVGLADYRDQERSPTSSRDLILASECPDLNPFYPYFMTRLTELLNEEQPSIIGFSLNYLSQALCTFAMIGFLKKECPGLSLVLGGGLVTSWMKRPGWRNPFLGLVDHLVAGPGEAPLLSLAGRNGMRDGRSRPDYGTLPVQDYLSPGFVLPYSGSSGCHWGRCAFCPESTEANTYIPIPVESVACELKTLVTEKKPALIHFLDNAMNASLLKSLAGYPPGVPWYGFARISRDLTDPGFCMALKRSGCVMLKLGLESGDQDVLDRMDKGIDLNMSSAALKAMHGAGIATYVYLLFGTPPETLTEAQRTLDFTVRHKNEISFLNLALFNMPVGSPEAEGLKTSGFYEGDLSLYTDFIHPKGWNRKQVRQFLEHEFKRHPAVSGILKKDPPLFTSNHAPFFIMAPPENPSLER